MQIREIIGLGAAALVLAGVATAIIYGDRTAKVLTATSNGFADIIRAATLQSSGHA